MKFQNPSFNFFLNGRTHTLTDKQKAICSPFFKVGGIKISYEFLRTLMIWLFMRDRGLKFHKNNRCFFFAFLLFGKHDTKLMRILHAGYFK